MRLRTEEGPRKPMLKLRLRAAYAERSGKKVEMDTGQCGSIAIEQANPARPMRQRSGNAGADDPVYLSE